MSSAPVTLTATRALFAGFAMQDGFRSTLTLEPNPACNSFDTCGERMLRRVARKSPAPATARCHSTGSAEVTDGCGRPRAYARRARRQQRLRKGGERIRSSCFVFEAVETFEEPKQLNQPLSWAGVRFILEGMCGTAEAAPGNKSRFSAGSGDCLMQGELAMCLCSFSPRFSDGECNRKGAEADVGPGFPKLFCHVTPDRVEDRIEWSIARPGSLLLAMG